MLTEDNIRDLNNGHVVKLDSQALFALIHGMPMLKSPEAIVIARAPDGYWVERQKPIELRISPSVLEENRRIIEEELAKPSIPEVVARARALQEEINAQGMGKPSRGN